MMVMSTDSVAILCCNHRLTVHPTRFKRLEHGTVKLVVLLLRSQRQHECRSRIGLRLLIVVRFLLSLIFMVCFESKRVLGGVYSRVVLLFTDRAQAALVKGL